MSWGSPLCCPPKAWADRVKESDITTPCMKLSSIKRDAIVDGNLVVADLADEWLDGCTHVKGFLKAHRELSKSKSKTVKLCNMAGNMQEVLTFMRAHDQPMAPSFHLLALKASYLQVLTKCGPQGLAWPALSTLFDNGVVGVLKEMAEDRSVGSSGVSPGGWLQGVVLPAVAMAIDGWGAEGDGVNVEPWIGDLASTVEALTSCGDILAEGPDLLTPVSALLTLVRASLTPPVVSAAEVSAAKILVTTDPKLSTWKAALERSEGGQSCLAAASAFMHRSAGDEAGDQRMAASIVALETPKLLSRRTLDRDTLEVDATGTKVIFENTECLYNNILVDVVRESVAGVQEAFGLWSRVGLEQSAGEVERWFALIVALLRAVDEALSTLMCAAMQETSLLESSGLLGGGGWGLGERGRERQHVRIRSHKARQASLETRFFGSLGATSTQ